MAICIERHLAKLAAENMRKAVVPGQSLIEICVIHLDQIEYAAVLTDNALEQQLGFLSHRLAEVIVKILEQTHVRNERVQIAQMQPLPGKISHQRPRSHI